jgi:aspartate/methionine/tyrosine aminotransferase
MENRFTASREAVRHLPDFLDLVNTNFHECGFIFPAELLEEAARRYFTTPDLRTYTPDPAGDHELRAAVAAHENKRDGPQVTAEHVVITASASESFSHIIAGECAPADRILLPRPGYPLFEDVASRHGVEALYYDQQWEAAWAIDPDQIATLMDERVRAVVLISPNNPTGHVLTEEEIAAVGEVCGRHDAALVVDEVWSGAIFTGGPPRRAAALAPQCRIYSINGVSKLLASPDLKVSWIVVDAPEGTRREVIDRLLIQNDLFLSASPLTELLAASALREGRDFAEAVRTELARRRTAALDALREIPRLRVVEPDGGIYLPILLDGALPGGMDEEDLAVMLLEERHLAIHPGYLYGCEQPMLIMSYLCPAPDIVRGLARLAEGLAGVTAPRGAR